MDDKGSLDKSGDRSSGERIAKVIARSGLASRRAAEEWIAAGRVAVNGEVIRSPALNVTPRDKVSVDGEPLPAHERTRLFLYHKRRGLVTSHSDPQGRPTIFARLPHELPRLISVGRLDFNTEGLMLLTNDGALARALELPETGWLRRYRVRAHGSVTQAKLDELKAGVTISGIRYREIDATLDRVQGSNVWLTFAIREGKNREVRNVLDHLGLTVTRLIRVSFGPFALGELAEGAVEEVPTRVLRAQLGERIVERSGADFSAALSARSPEKEAPRAAKPSKAPAPTHSWRAPEEERPTKKLSRKFRGSRRQDEKAPARPGGQARADVLTDRKGRSVPVERFGRPPQREESKVEDSFRGRRSRRAFDRRSGPRPRRPREK
jgi:23S rRNA pseudouridine2605 synthase